MCQLQTYGFQQNPQKLQKAARQLGSLNQDELGCYALLSISDTLVRKRYAGVYSIFYYPSTTGYRSSGSRGDGTSRSVVRHVPIRGSSRPDPWYGTSRSAAHHVPIRGSSCSDPWYGTSRSAAHHIPIRGTARPDPRLITSRSVVRHVPIRGSSHPDPWGGKLRSESLKLNLGTRH